jgi:hypothetical protein
MLARQGCWVALTALVGILTGCSIGDVRRTPSAPTPSAPIQSSADPSGPPSQVPVAETRTSRLAVPERYDRPYVEFVDAQQGYALFGACDGRPPVPDCPALLFATRDGGRSWQRLRHPKPVADDQQLYTAPGMLALWSEAHSWWTSTDGGATFRHSPRRLRNSSCSGRESTPTAPGPPWSSRPTDFDRARPGCRVEGANGSARHGSRTPWLEAIVG